MKLWLLRPIENNHENSWSKFINFGYDCTYGFVIQAESEQEARQIAQCNGSDETKYWDSEKAEMVIYPVWIDKSLSTCVELVAEGEPGIVIEDFHAG